MSTPAPPLTQAQNPWPGLLWYTEEQAHLFFGRETETQELLRLIQRETLTVLFGRSGLGKTSLLRAGVFPRLRQEGFFPVVLRLDYTRLAGSPVEQVKALTEVAARKDGIDIESEQEAPEGETLWEYFHRVHFWGRRNDRLIPILVFDQFEEIFTVGNRRQEDCDILEQLADLAENRVPAALRERAEASGERLTVETGVPQYKIVLSLREDFVWRLDTLRPILPAIMRNRFALGPLDAARGFEIIRNSGKQWVTDEVAQDIVDAVISSRGGEAGGSAAQELEPAYLNVMCNELFERMVATGQTRITRELVAAEKGGILESLYERSLSGFDDSVRRFVEENLVTPAGFRATMPVEEARREHISDADLQKLVDRRLLRFEDRLGTRHVELAHDLLTGLVQKSRERRNQARLQRQLRLVRLRAAIWATVAVAVIAAGALYWLAYMYRSTAYYATYARRTGSVEPFGRLSKNEADHRSESLRVTRKGFRGEVLSVEAVNGYGQLIVGSSLENSFFYPSKGVDRHFSRLEFSYNEKGSVVNEAALDKQGRLVFAIVYAPSQADSFQNVRRASVVGTDGTKVLSSFDINYDAGGYVREIRYGSAEGTKMTYGASVVRLETSAPPIHDGELFLGEDGRPVPANQDFAGKKFSHDARGEVLETVFHDLDGNPVVPPDGTPPIVRRQRDEWGNETGEAFFDVDGKPTIWEAGGYQKITYLLNDHGSVLESRFFDPDGKPAGLKNSGCYAIRYGSDQTGNRNLSSCLDAQGAPMNQADTGYQKVTYQFDSAGRTIGDQFYDHDGKPAADKRTIGEPYAAGCYGWEWGYDADFDSTDPFCLDANGKAYDPGALRNLAHTAHEEAFDFDRAFDLYQQLVEQDRTPVNHLDLEEAALSAGRFDVCQAQAVLIKDSDMSATVLIMRDALLLACQFASGNKPAAHATASTVTGRLSELSEGTWNFSGTLYYIQSSTRFQNGNDAWDRLFLSLQKGDTKGVAAALNQLQPQLKN
jgi:hypothetical protein